MVLALKNKQAQKYISFLPLALAKSAGNGINLTREIEFGGMPYSIYSGLLCLPDFERIAIPLLASFIQSELRWDLLQFRWMKDQRIHHFLKSFSQTKYIVKVYESLKSLRISFTVDSVDSFITNMGKSNRKILRRRTKNIKENKNFKITYSTSGTIERDIDALCELWFKRWKKQAEVQFHRYMLHHFFEYNLLRLSLIWDGKIPISAVACITDPDHKTYNAYITSYNPDYAELSPGFVLNAESIKEAIDHNYKYYDFTVGLDSYKLAFGPEKIKTESITIKKKNLKNRMKYLVKKIKTRLKQM